MAEPEVTRGLPADLASVLQDQSIIVPQDGAVFEVIAAWAKAPIPTASAGIAGWPEFDQFLQDLCRQMAPSSTTSAGCI